MRNISNTIIDSLPKPSISLIIPNTVVLPIPRNTRDVQIIEKYNKIRSHIGEPHLRRQTLIWQKRQTTNPITRSLLSREIQKIESQVSLIVADLTEQYHPYHTMYEHIPGLNNITLSMPGITECIPLRTPKNPEEEQLIKELKTEEQRIQVTVTMIVTQCRDCCEAGTIDVPEIKTRLAQEVNTITQQYSVFLKNIFYSGLHSDLRAQFQVYSPSSSENDRYLTDVSAIESLTPQPPSYEETMQLAQQTRFSTVNRSNVSLNPPSYEEIDIDISTRL